MVKKCPPGVICVQNMVFVSMFIVTLGLLAFIVYRGILSTNNSQTNIETGITKSQKSWFDTSPLNGLFPRPSYSFSNVENDVLMNPYSAPLRDDRYITNDIRGGVPINISTRAVDADYRQIGILTRQNGSEAILPLMGRPLFTNRDKWQFYTMNDKNIKLPIVNKGKSCTNEYGCDNLYNGDTIYVEGMNDTFKVTVYDNAIMKYIPFV